MWFNNKHYYYHHNFLIVYKSIIITYHPTSTQPILCIRIFQLKHLPLVALPVLFRDQVAKDRNPFQTSLRKNNENVLAHLTERSGDWVGLWNFRNAKYMISHFLSFSLQESPNVLSLFSSAPREGVLAAEKWRQKLSEFYKPRGKRRILRRVHR